MIYKPLSHKYGSFQNAVENIIGKKQMCVVAIDPRNGRILALVNPDMSCRKAYPPGSILKLLTAFAGLESGITTPDKTIECRNLFVADGESLICSKAGGHGRIDLQDAISKSCNVYFYKLGNLIGEQKLLKCFYDFGLGKRIGISISGENTGSVPGILSNRIEIAQAAIGESNTLRATAIQMAVIAAAIVNGGIEYMPKAGYNAKPVVLRRINSHPGTFAFLRKAMRMAVIEGTAKKADILGLSVCGKTGSPAIEDNPNYRHGWFIGFAPYEKPEIALAVFTEWGHGGTDAAPVARRVLSAWTRSRVSKNHSSSSSSSISSRLDGE